MKSELLAVLTILVLAGCASTEKNTAAPDSAEAKAAEEAWLNDPDWDNDDGGGK